MLIEPHIMLPIPKVGEDIYVDSAYFIDHGEDDREGGLARVSKIWEVENGGRVAHRLEVEEFLGLSYSWEYDLAPQQNKLKGRFGARRASYSPD